MEQKPSVGRIVLYYPTEEEKVNCNGQEFVPAIITAVWSDTMINCKVLNDGEKDFWKTSIEVKTETLTNSCWSWVPRV